MDFILKLYTWKCHDCMYLFVNTAHCTHANTTAPWLSQRPEFEALVLLDYCCIAAAVTVDTVTVCSVAARSVLNFRQVWVSVTSFELRCYYHCSSESWER